MWQPDLYTCPLYTLVRWLSSIKRLKLYRTEPSDKGVGGAQPKLWLLQRGNDVEKVLAFIRSPLRRDGRRHQQEEGPKKTLKTSTAALITPYARARVAGGTMGINRDK